MNFKLTSAYEPSGDQPEAIKQLVAGLNNGEKAQTLLGVTGSGKTFTIANVLNQVNRPALILSHNKTLAAQLYSEFKQFFPPRRRFTSGYRKDKLIIFKLFFCTSSWCSGVCIA